MLEKRIVGLAAFLTLAGWLFPLAAQQGTAPQPTVPGAAQPSTPSDPSTPPVKPPVIPRRLPIPAQPPGSIAPQGVPPGAAQAPAGQSAVPQPGSEPGIQLPPSPQETPAPQVPGVPAVPQRRLQPSPGMPTGGMISLNFNRADLVEIIHIIAQQLRLTYTIDP